MVLMLHDDIGNQGGRYKVLSTLAVKRDSRGLVSSTLIVEDQQVHERRYVAKVFNRIDSQRGRLSNVRSILSNNVFVDNSSVCQLRGYEEARGVGYLLFDYVDGISLKSKLSQEGRLSPAQVEEIVVETLEILKPIHREGFVHSDIKPSNLMVRSQDGQIVLVDFDSMIRINDLGGARDATRGYAPPEQMAGTISAQNDLYAVGMTAIRLLTAQNVRTLKRNPHGELILPENLGIHSCFQEVLIGLTHADPSQRYLFAEEAIDRLFRTVTTEVVAPRGEEVAEEHEMTGLQRFKGFVSVVILVTFASFVGGYLVFSGLIRPSRREPSLVFEEPQRGGNSISTSTLPSDSIPDPRIIEGQGSSSRQTGSNIDVFPNTRSVEEEVMTQKGLNDTDKATEPTSSVSKDSDSGSLFRDGRSKETQKTKENKNVPADSLTSNANPVSKNREDSGLLFRDGR